MSHFIKTYFVKLLIFWDVTMCTLESNYTHFREAQCVFTMKYYTLLKNQQLFTSWQDITSQMTWFFINTTQKSHKLKQDIMWPFQMTIILNLNTKDLTKNKQKSLWMSIDDTVTLTDWFWFQLPLTGRVQELTASTSIGSGFRRIPDISSKLQP